MSDSDVVIRVEGLGKKYALHHEKSERYTALRDVVARQARAAGRLLNPFTLAGQLRKAQRDAAAEGAESEEDFWALKDVSFEIRRGERVGIIGRNGAGKSTLLKILSRITEPTMGRVEIRGRVASLLEVGTGFHPELTGRENIYLNGAILGMTRREIRSKFDEIVDFAEVEKFLDTPVKRYSSGMYVRLAFAVAAHLEPEMLVVDEVLAVGDSRFQKKCIGKMEQASEGDGKTILFVSHDVSAIRKLCIRSMLFQEGYLIHSGRTESVVTQYLDSNNPRSTSNKRTRRGEESFIMSADAAPLWESNQNILRIDLTIENPSRQYCVEYTLYDRMNRAIGWGRSHEITRRRSTSRKEPTSLSLWIDIGDLCGGSYSVSVKTCIYQVVCLDEYPSAMPFEVLSRERDHALMVQDWGLGSIHFKTTRYIFDERTRYD